MEKNTLRQENERLKRRIHELEIELGRQNMHVPGNQAETEHLFQSMAGAEILEKIFFQNTTIMYIMDPENLKIVSMNEAGLRFYGIPHENSGRMKETDFNILPETILLSTFRNAQINKIEQFEFIHRINGGGEKYVQVHAIPIKILHKPYLFNIVTDITGRKIAEDQLRQSETRYREMIENMPVMYYETDLQMMIRYLNHSGMNITGYGTTDIHNGIGLTDLFPEKEKLIPNFHKAMRGERKNLMDYELLKKDGEKTHIMLMSLPLYKDGEVAGIRSIGFDISQQLKIKEQLLASEERFRQFAQLLPETVYEIDLQGNFLFLNDHSYQIFGYDKSDSGLNAFKMMDPEDLPKIKRNIQAILDGKDPDDHEYIAMRKDGSRFPVLLYSEKKMENGKVTGFRGFIIDNTQTVETKRALKESEEKYRSLTEQLPVGIYRTTLDGKFLFVNKFFSDLLGYDSQEELLMIPVNELYKDKKFRKQQLSQHTGKGESHTKELALVRRDGQTIWVKDNYKSYLEKEAKSVYFDGFIEDITHKKVLEERLKQAEKLLAIGSMASGIAHDFNNLLMGMQLYTELALKTAAGDNRQTETLEKVLMAQVRGKQLVEQILNFSKQPEDTFEIFEFHKIVEEAIQLIESTFPTGIQLQKEIKDCGKVKMNPLHIHQICMNLITNSIHAMDSHGTLRISAVLISGKSLPQLQPRINTECSYIQWIFSDSGPGIDPSIQKKIFDPFFTTKKAGTGTGLGLSIVNSIVSIYHGEILLESNANSGTRFLIYLPVAKNFQQQ